MCQVPLGRARLNPLRRQSSRTVATAGCISSSQNANLFSARLPSWSIWWTFFPRSRCPHPASSRPRVEHRPGPMATGSAVCPLRSSRPRTARLWCVNSRPCRNNFIWPVRLFSPLIAPSPCSGRQCPGLLRKSISFGRPFGETAAAAQGPSPREAGSHHALQRPGAFMPLLEWRHWSSR